MSDEGNCKFRCRTNRQAFIAGYKAGLVDSDYEYLGISKDETLWEQEDEDAAKQAYREWRKGCEA